MKRLPFKPALALAIREGRKTETRRLIAPQPPRQIYQEHPGLWATQEEEGHSHGPYKPAYSVGEIVGIAEPWRTLKTFDELSGAQLVAKRALCLDVPIFYDADPKPHAVTGRARLARFLPDAFVLTKLRILAVTAERLQDITEEQAKAEGIEWVENGDLPRWKVYTPHHTCVFKPEHARESFGSLWDTIHGEEAPWSSNPWVWRYQFEITHP